MKIITKVVMLAVLLMGLSAVTNAEKVEHLVKIKQVNLTQAIVYCKNGALPQVNTSAVTGFAIVSCPK